MIFILVVNITSSSVLIIIAEPQRSLQFMLYKFPTKTKTKKTDIKFSLLEYREEDYHGPFYYDATPLIKTFENLNTLLNVNRYFYPITTLPATLLSKSSLCLYYLDIIVSFIK